MSCCSEPSGALSCETPQKFVPHARALRATAALGVFLLVLLLGGSQWLGWGGVTAAAGPLLPHLLLNAAPSPRAGPSSVLVWGKFRRSLSVGFWIPFPPLGTVAGSATAFVGQQAVAGHLDVATDASAGAHASERCGPAGKGSLAQPGLRGGSAAPGPAYRRLWSPVQGAFTDRAERACNDAFLLSLRRGWDVCRRPHEAQHLSRRTYAQLRKSSARVFWGP